MRNNSVAFKIHDNIGPFILEMATRGYRKITVYIIFNLELGAGFTCKARPVADGQKFVTPPSMTYEYVVSRDNIRMVLLLAALNGFYVQCANVHNFYLHANSK